MSRGGFALSWVVSNNVADTVTWHNGNLGGMKPFGGRSSTGWSYTTLQNSDAGNLNGPVEDALRAVPFASWLATDRWASAQLPAW
jgi:hypothetical protein